MQKATPLLFNIICGVFISLPIITVFAGRFMEVVVPLLSLFILVYFYKTKQSFECNNNFIWLSLLAFLAVVLMSLTHGIQHIGHYKTYLFVVLTVIAMIISGKFIVNLNEDRFFRYFAYSIISASLLTLFFIFSFNKNDFITNTFKSLHLFNRVAAALSIWAIPLILIVREHSLLQISLIISVSLVALFSMSGTAPLILGTALAAFILTYQFKQPFIILSAVCLCVFILLIPNIATLPKLFIPSEVHEVLTEASTHHRAELWNSYAILTKQNWFTGWGFEASRMAAKNPIIASQFKDPEFSLGSHPHFMLLQIYFEQGILAIIAILTGLYGLLRSILKLNRLKSAVCIASFAGTLAMTSVNFSIWQHWIIVMIGIQIAFCVYLSKKT